MSEYFQKQKSLRANVKVESDLSNYATKADLKMQQVLIHQILPQKKQQQQQKNDLANLKSDVDKLDIDKLKDVPINLSN